MNIATNFNAGIELRCARWPHNPDFTGLNSRPRYQFSPTKQLCGKLSSCVREAQPCREVIMLTPLEKATAVAEGTRQRAAEIAIEVGQRKMKQYEDDPALATADPRIKHAIAIAVNATYQEIANAILEAQ
jgi:hypothetical protein